MKNLKEYQIQDMSLNEMQEIEGGSLAVAVAVVIAVAVGVAAVLGITVGRNLCGCSND